MAQDAAMDVVEPDAAVPDAAMDSGVEPRGAVDSGQPDAAVDPCAAQDNPLQSDFDGDGLLDSCDEDDDNDGFVDGDDPAPLDPTRPGDFSTPEKILENPLVKAAIEGAQAMGTVPDRQLELDPPDISGYYRSDEATGTTYATDTGQDVGGTLVGIEQRIEVSSSLETTGAAVYVWPSQPDGYWVGSGSLLRGSGGRYTVYGRGHQKCTRGGSDYSLYIVSIGSGEVLPESGDLVNDIGLAVTVDTAGTLTGPCQQSFQGNRELVGGWSVQGGQHHVKIDASALRFMCVDEGKGYAPTESWQRQDGTDCTCDMTYKVACM